MLEPGADGHPFNVSLEHHRDEDPLIPERILYGMVFLEVFYAANLGHGWVAHKHELCYLCPSLRDIHQHQGKTATLIRFPLRKPQSKSKLRSVNVSDTKEEGEAGGGA